jgi:hypothetical protein
MSLPIYHLPLDMDASDLEIVIRDGHLWISVHDQCLIRIDRLGICVLSLDGEVSVLHATLERSQ